MTILYKISTTFTCYVSDVIRLGAYSRHIQCTCDDKSYPHPYSGVNPPPTAGLRGADCSGLFVYILAGFYKKPHFIGVTILYKISTTFTCYVSDVIRLGAYSRHIQCTCDDKSYPHPYSGVNPPPTAGLRGADCSGLFVYILAGFYKKPHFIGVIILYKISTHLYLLRFRRGLLRVCTYCDVTNNRDVPRFILQGHRRER